MLPLSKPFFDDKEALAVQDVLASGWVTQGPKVKAFEAEFAEYVGAKHACAVSNCTVALQLALQAVGVKPGNVVITVSHSYIATANSVRNCFAEPVFVDIDLTTYNMSPACLQSLLVEQCQRKDGKLYYPQTLDLAAGESPLCFLDKTHAEFGRVAAILVVHQVGMPADMNAIMPIAKQFGLPVVEDAACAIGSEIQYSGQWQRVGNPIGDVVCFSFHPRKVLTTGDGGMLTTNHSNYDETFRLLRQHGMGVSDAVRHQAKQLIIESYLTTGFNYRLTDIQAAVGIEQLHKLPAFLQRRMELVQVYEQHLRNTPWVALPEQAEWARTNWQSYPVMFSSDAPLGRDELMQTMLDAGIATRPGIMNAHQEMPYQNHREVLSASELAREQVILLPLFHTMTEDDVRLVCQQLNMVLAEARENRQAALQAKN
jgi:perosamine synthetase